MSTPIQIADAVAKELNATPFTMPFTATRKYVAAFKLTELKTLRVTVIPATIARTQVSRGHKSQTVRIDVAVHQRVGTVGSTEELDEDTLDRLAALVEEIAEHFAANLPTLPAPASARWISSETDPIFDPEHLDSSRVFTSVVRLTFQKIG